MPSSEPRARWPLVDVVAIFVTIGLIVGVAVDLPVELRTPLAVAFMTFVPGWALLDHVLPTAVESNRFALAAAVSLAVMTLATVSVAWLHLWNPAVLLFVVGGICLVALLLHVKSDWADLKSVATPEWLLRLELSDLLLPVAVGLWLFGVRATEASDLNDFGLLAAFPAVFFVGVGLLVSSIVATVTQAQLSPTRLTLHLAALVVMLHATMPLIFDEPIYPWAYKHVGVVGYINLFGNVDPGIDIYHSWPGFFTLAAWFTQITGAASPLDYAAWTPLYINLLICLMLGFVFRTCPVSQRARWLALFIFVMGNWVGQDYFAPQSLAFVLSLALFGITLAWMQSDRPAALVLFARKLMAKVGGAPPTRTRDEDVAAGEEVSRSAAYGLLFLVFTAIVVSHQLSPYVVLLGLGVVSAAGLVRPRWVIAALGLVAVGYLMLNLSALEQRDDLFESVLNPFTNIFGGAQDDGAAVLPGRRVTALAAPALVMSLWALAAVGAVRRLAERRPTLLLALLATSPVLIALGQSYGGEAVFRIYLFSLPWVALLGGSALDLGSARRCLWAVPTAGVVLLAAVVMFGSTTFGAAELYMVTAGERQASEYFYSRAEPGSQLSLVSPNFPTRVGANYADYTSQGDNPPDLLTSVPGLRHRRLGSKDLPAISKFVASDGGLTQDEYLVLSGGQAIYAEVLGLVPAGSLGSLGRSLSRSANWEVFYRNQDAVIYHYAPPPAAGTVEAALSQPADWTKVFLDLAPVPNSQVLPRTIGWLDPVHAATADWATFVRNQGPVIYPHRKQ